AKPASKQDEEELRHCGTGPEKMLSVQRVAEPAFIEVDGTSVIPPPGHAAICHGPTRGHENDQLEARGSPSRLGLAHRAHSRSRIYGRNRTSHQHRTTGSPCFGAGSIYDRNGSKHVKPWVLTGRSPNLFSREFFIAGGVEPLRGST